MTTALDVAAVDVTAHSPIAELVRPVAVTVRHDGTLGEAARLMRAANVSAVLVDGGDAIVTERDITQAFADGRSQTTSALTVAVRHPVTVSADTTVVGAAAAMLANNVRHLVVTDGDVVVGVVSLRPVMRVLTRAMDPAVWAALHRTIVNRTEIWIG